MKKTTTQTAGVSKQVSRSKKNLQKLLSVFFTGCFLFPQSVFADFKLRDAIQEFGEKRFIETTPGKNLKAGPVKIHPTLETRATYDSNILRENVDRREDVIFNVRPGAILELPIDKHQLAVGYEADFENFVKRSDQNDQNQNFFALADFNFPSWYINILEEFTETSDRAGTTFTARIPRIDQYVNPKVGYRWKRLVFETGYRNFIRDFRRFGERELDFKLNEWTNVVYYDLFARLKALVDYHIGFLDYPNTFKRNATINQFRVGLEGEVRPNLFVKTRTGMQFRNYLDNNEPDYYSWVLKSEVEYRARKNLKLKAFFNREPVEATFGDVNYYLEHQGGLGFEYLLQNKWVAFGDISMAFQRYAERATLSPETTIYRRDRVFSLKPGVRYLINPSWQMELAYELALRHSNFSGFNYADNVVYLSSKLAY